MMLLSGQTSLKNYKISGENAKQYDENTEDEIFKCLGAKNSLGS